MRGEFITGAGEVVSNNISAAGAKIILERALQGVVSAPMYMGLCNGVYVDDLDLTGVEEPTFTNGYARQLVNQSIIDWPTIGQLDGEYYVESKPIVFTATGAGFSSSISRLMLTFSQTALVGPVFCLSVPLSSSRIITPATELADRTFLYRIYLR